MRVLCLLAFLLFAFSAHAQTDVIVNWRAPGGTTPVTNANPLPVSASVSASITGFRPTAYGTPISATTGGATGTLPAGAEVVATNVGTFGAFCKLGASVDTTGQYLSPGGAWFAFAISGDTQLTCQGVGGTTTINMAGGSGLPTGTGGGGGSSSGGTSAVDEATFTYGTTAYTPGGCVYNASITNLTSGQGGAFSCDNTRALFINVLSGSTLYNLLSAGAATNGSTYPGSSIGIGWKDGSGFIQPASAATPFPIQPQAFTSGGWSSTSLIAANSNNSTNIKASAGVIHGLQIYGIGSSPAWLKLYDKATAPTCGTDTPVARYLIPAAATAANGAGNNAIQIDKQFSTGIGFCVVQNIGDSDNTSVPASTYVINIGWK